MTTYMPKKISWLDGQWFINNEIKLPMIDRGLSLGDGLFETILISNNEPQLLDAHLDRWHRSASLLGMASPPGKNTVLRLLEEALDQISLSNGTAALRLNWSRGNNDCRGINLSNTRFSASFHKFWFELNEYNPCFSSIATIISRNEKRNADSRLSQVKTFSYVQSIQARYEANLAGCDDALLLSTKGGICCGTTANILIRRNNQWLTPHLQSGCLPGIMRQQGLDKQIFKEATISPEPERGDQWVLINSLTCQSITKINKIVLNEYQDTEALWRSLLPKSN